MFNIFKLMIQFTNMHFMNIIYSRKLKNMRYYRQLYINYLVFRKRLPKYMLLTKLKHHMKNDIADLFINKNKIPFEFVISGSDSHEEFLMNFL